MLGDNRLKQAMRSLGQADSHFLKGNTSTADYVKDITKIKRLYGKYVSKLNSQLKFLGREDMLIGQNAKIQQQIQRGLKAKSRSLHSAGSALLTGYFGAQAGIQAAKSVAAAAAPNGSAAISGPLGVLGASIGSVVLPAVTELGTAAMNAADRLEGLKNSSGVKTGAAIMTGASAVTGALVGGALGSFLGPMGTWGGAALGGRLGGMFGAGISNLAVKDMASKGKNNISGQPFNEREATKRNLSAQINSMQGAMSGTVGVSDITSGQWKAQEGVFGDDVQMRQLELQMQALEVLKQQLANLERIGVR